MTRVPSGFHSRINDSPAPGDRIHARAVIESQLQARAQRLGHLTRWRVPLLDANLLPPSRSTMSSCPAAPVAVIRPLSSAPTEPSSNVSVCRTEAVRK